MKGELTITKRVVEVTKQVELLTKTIYNSVLVPNTVLKIVPKIYPTMVIWHVTAINTWSNTIKYFQVKSFMFLQKGYCDELGYDIGKLFYDFEPTYYDEKHEKFLWEEALNNFKELTEI